MHMDSTVTASISPAAVTVQNPRTMAVAFLFEAHPKPQLAARLTPVTDSFAY
jgi:hypothetical protein